MWASTSLSVARVLPLAPAVFDLVVIDEASQCDIPSALPLLVRARRALIIGDPNQLIHVSTLAPRVDRRLADRHGVARERWFEGRFEFSRRSLYDAAASAPDAEPLLLADHYRSHPDIIEFSNRAFYKGDLYVLTDPKDLLPSDEAAIRWIHVEGRAERPPGGSARNEREAQTACEEALRLIESLPEGKTLGIVTPFSRQADLIVTTLKRLIPEETIWQARRLTAATAHKFQGDERDVIVFSPVVSDGLPLRSQQWVAGNLNLLNVAVTRARSLLVVVGNSRVCGQGDGALPS